MTQYEPRSMIRLLGHNLFIKVEYLLNSSAHKMRKLYGH